MVDTSAMVTPDVKPDVAVPVAARSRLESIRDEGMRPTMERNEELAQSFERVVGTRPALYRG